MSFKRQWICISVFVLTGLAFVPASQAGITVTAPNIEVDYEASTANFTISVQSTDSYAVNWYELVVNLAAQSDATGVTFHSTAAANTDYILGNNSWGWDSTDTSSQISGNDALDGDYVTVPLDGTMNMITVNLTLAPGSSNVNDVYDVTFDAGSSGIFGAYDDVLDDWTEYNDVTWTPGTITITPEPATLSLLGLGALALLRRRKK